MTWTAPAQILARKTHCCRGHAYTDDNTYRKDDGYRRCKECRRIDARADYWRKRRAA